jgi:hypothetical protein
MAQHRDFSDQSSSPPFVDDTERFRAFRAALKDATTQESPARRNHRINVRSRLRHLVRLER